MLTTIDSQIITAMARALHVCAYADASDAGQLPEGHERAGQGSDWMDIAPETSAEAKEFAAYTGGRIAAMNGQSLFFLCRAAAMADGENPDDIGGKYVDDFGHYLAMQCLGHGVSWFDDHAKFDLKLPHVEFYWE